MQDNDLDRSVGKLITGKVQGLVLDAGTERAIADGAISGVTLFKDNASDLNQLFDLIAQVRAVGGDDFIVAVDQEGGAVQRFDHILTPMPSAMALAALNHDGRVFDLMQMAARQLHLLGVNCNLTPVLDVNSNPLNPIIGTRSFGDNVDRIAKLGEIVAKAHKQNHVLPVGKHFPGHGDTSEDSHMKMAVDRASKELLAERELKPFAECARALPAMLVGHVWLPAYDESILPASLSKTVSTDLLRRTMNYQGYLFTDDMPVMKAIVDHWGLAEAAIMAVNAGADNLLVSGSLEQMMEVHGALKKAFLAGDISEERLLQALKRRTEAMAFTTGTVQYKKEARQHLAELIESDAHKSLQASVSSIALVRGTIPRSLRESPESWLVVLPDHPRYGMPLSEALSQGEARFSERRYTVDPSFEEIEEIADAAIGKNCLLVTFRALLNEGQMRLSDALDQVAGADKILVASDVPYDVARLSKWTNALATFDPSDNAFRALATILLGKASPRGKCPVSLESL